MATCLVIAATRPAYYLADFELADAEAIKPYSAAVESTFRPYGGRYVIRGGAATQLEGEAPRGLPVMIAFDRVAQAQAWYDSPAYDKLKPIRHRAARARDTLVSRRPITAVLRQRRGRSPFQQQRSARTSPISKPRWASG